MDKSSSSSFDSFYVRVKEILESARSNAYRAVNFVMVQAYWDIGRSILEEVRKGSDRSEYGKYLVETLSVRLVSEFGKGFDKTNIWNMIRFYRAFPILDALRRELSWTHYRILMRVEKDSARIR